MVGVQNDGGMPLGMNSYLQATNYACHHVSRDPSKTKPKVVILVLQPPISMTAKARISEHIVAKLIMNRTKNRRAMRRLS